MKELSRYPLPTTVYCAPGDTFICTIEDKNTGNTYEFQEKIGRNMTIDTIVTFDIDTPTLKVVDGVGVIFGETA